MESRATFIVTAALLALGQQPLSAEAQTAVPAATAVGSNAASRGTPVIAKSPTGWIEYDDSTVTPVLDDVSQALANARTALAANDQAGTADALRAAARALAVEADRAGSIDRQRAAADLTLARETQARLQARAKKLDATAARIQAGKRVTTAALDKTLDKAARADLERRWLAMDVTGWYAVAGEPQRHLDAAAADHAKGDDHAAAAEVRKAAAFMRLESARTVGEARKDLDTANAEMEKTARALDSGRITGERNLDKVFADADRALALSHRAMAEDDWSRKSYDDAGYELKAAAEGLGDAAAWTGGEATSAASAGVSDARAVGDKLASGGVWAKNEVARAFEALGGALDRLGQSLGSKPKAAPFDIGG